MLKDILRKNVLIDIFHRSLGIMIAQTVISKETLEVNDKIFPKPFR